MNKLRKITPEWVDNETPTDKLLSRGAGNLTTEELIAIIIGSESSIGQRLLESSGGSLTELGRMSPAQMNRIEGVTASRAIKLNAAMELGRRERSEASYRQERIVGSNDIIALFDPLLRSLPYEEVWLLMLTSGKHIIEKVRLSSGGSNNSPIDIKLVLRNALEQLAAGVVVVHNHPGGNCAPSQYDLDITRRLKNALEIMDVKLLDHIIISYGESFSFAERGLI